MPTTLRGDDHLHSAGYLKSNTALSDAAANITATQLLAGEFTITPTVARILTLPTALLTIAEADWTVDGQNSEITIVNAAAFDVTLAVNTGVTIVGRAVINNGSATFRVRRLTSTTVEVKRLEGVAAVSTPVRCRVFHNTNQSLATATTLISAFNSETFDNDSMHDNSTNNSRITINTAGVYLIKGQAAFSANATGHRNLFVKKNGAVKFGSVYLPAAPAADRTVIQVVVLMELVATDYLQMEVIQQSGATLQLEGTAGDENYQTNFEVIRMGVLT